MNLAMRPFRNVFSQKGIGGLDIQLEKYACKISRNVEGVISADLESFARIVERERDKHIYHLPVVTRVRNPCLFLVVNWQSVANSKRAARTKNIYRRLCAFLFLKIDFFTPDLQGAKNCRTKKTKGEMRGGRRAVA